LFFDDSRGGALPVAVRAVCIDGQGRVPKTPNPVSRRPDHARKQRLGECRGCRFEDQHHPDWTQAPSGSSQTAQFKRRPVSLEPRRRVKGTCRIVLDSASSRLAYRGERAFRLHAACRASTPRPRHCVEELVARRRAALDRELRGRREIDADRENREHIAGLRGYGAWIRSLFAPPPRDNSLTRSAHCTLTAGNPGYSRGRCTVIETREFESKPVPRSGLHPRARS